MSHKRVGISLSVSSSILTVGLECKDHRGGIGGVIETYSKYFSVFNYVCSYGTSENKFVIVFKYLKSLVELPIVFIKDRNIQIVHIHGAAKGSFFRKYIIFLLSKYVFGKKVIFHCHGSEMEKFYLKSPQIVRKMMSNFFNNVDLVICLSNSWALFFTLNFTPRKLVVLENIVEEALDKSIKDFQIDKPIHFLFMGAVGNRKGIFDLLATIALHKLEFSGKMKLLIGGNGEIKRLNEFIAINQLSEIVIYEGWVSGALKNKLFNEADVYILPSYNEGLPISILEAMTYGLPVISTNVGGIPEIITNGINGCVINPGDREAIYASLRFFIDNPLLCKEYGKNTMEIVEPYYAKNVIPKLESIYIELLTQVSTL
ncbi:glycosyltransferase family 4 protein [Flavobacterium franklandianum]|uniref:Glycosyltransferase family 4 protein n=1 Tax=Flavobacterium franklandianum TaxID=2594430 RepID=A0A553C5S2_9FLAO|nr:glycosyltransferase family 4 protein [Flavobacterium franklandianum]TRX15848.1 glycosyltransferase family 4 protein [Flavobacterium franklandianum]